LEESLVACEQPVQGRQFRQGGRLQGPALVRADECPELLAQAAGLSRDLVKFAGEGLLPQCREGAWRHQFGLRQPVCQALTVRDPVDRSVDGCGDRVEEVQAERVGQEQRRRVLHHPPPLSLCATNIRRRR
jgi:hypothetical protein